MPLQICQGVCAAVYSGDLLLVSLWCDPPPRPPRQVQGGAQAKSKVCCVALGRTLLGPTAKVGAGLLLDVPLLASTKQPASPAWHSRWARVPRPSPDMLAGWACWRTAG